MKLVVVIIVVVVVIYTDCKSVVALRMSKESLEAQ